MTLQVVAAQTAPDTWSFTVTGVTGPTFVIDYGDGSAPVTVPTDASGTTVVSHQYVDPGHRDYTVTVTAAITPYASTLKALDDRFAGDPESMFPAVATGSADATPNLEGGEEFTPTVDGIVTAVRFYRMATATVTSRNVHVWRPSDGALLATAASAGESGSGWVTVPLPAPLPVTAGQTFIASYNGGNGLPLAGSQASTAPHLTSGQHLYAFAHDTMPVAPVGGNNCVLADVVFVANGVLADLAADPLVPTLADIPRATDTVTAAVTVDVGPATIWATVLPGTPPTVQVDTLVGDPETVTSWTVTRDVPGDSAPIWIGTTHSGAMSFVDVTPPLGVPITYRLNLQYANGSTVSVSAAPVTVTGTTGCFVTDPLSGRSVAVEIARWPVRRRDPRRAVLTVLGRSDPVVVSDVHSTPSGTVTFLTRTDQATAALMSTLTASGYVVIRTQPGSSMPPLVTVSVGEIAENRYTGTSGDQRRLNEVAVQEIADLPATAQPLGADLEGLSTLGDTLLDLSLVRPTLRQLSMIETGV